MGLLALAGLRPDLTEALVSLPFSPNTIRSCSLSGARRELKKSEDL